MADVVQRFGEALHLARRRREMTIKDLAVATGVSPSIISLVEIGKRPQVSFAVIAKLAKRLPVSLDALLKEEEADETAPTVPFDDLPRAKRPTKRPRTPAKVAES